MVGRVILASVILLAYVLLTESISQKRCSLTCVSVSESGKPYWYKELKLNLLRIQNKHIGHGKTTRQVSLCCRSRAGICISSQNVVLAESIAQKRRSLTCVCVGVGGKPSWYVELKLNLPRVLRDHIEHSKTTWQVSLRSRSRICIYSQTILENSICIVRSKQGVTNEPTGSVIRPVFIAYATKPKRGKSRISYHSNTTATFNCTLSAILICGDVHPHPGPESQIPVRITSRRNLPCVPSRSRNKGNLININVQNTVKPIYANFGCGQRHNIKISHLNVRSLKNREHFLQIKDLILNGDFDVFTISETWLNSTVKNAEINVDGYRLVRLDRILKTGGGVCAYVRNSLKIKKLEDLTATSANGFQQLWFSLQHKKLKSLLVCNAYRPPGCPITCFTEDFVPKYSQALTLRKDIIIAGDLNCNLLSDSLESRALKDLCTSMNY